MNIYKQIKNILNYVNLNPDIDDHERIHEIIQKDIVFKGTNLWILMFAIIVASVGLNMNSTAVVIGAMLISPLMGPINGIGYSIATYNFPLFYKALKNYSFAVVAGLIASTFYFSLTPISTAHSELLARTSPSIYDVLIAFFGGMAGIIAICSKQKGNVIPGVAIATALMPPLCTAGYGLATGQLNFLFGALYLFTINSVFIAVSAMLVSQFLKFKISTVVLETQKRRINRLISFITILILIPSFYFGYNLVQREKFILNANLFVNSISLYEGNFLLKHEIDPSSKTIILSYGGKALTEEEKQIIRKKTKDFSLHKTQIIFQQGLKFDSMDDQQAELESLKSELNRLNIIIQNKNITLDSILNKKMEGKQLLKEASTLFPQIVSVYSTDSYKFTKINDTPEQFEIVIFGLNDSIESTDEYLRIENWIHSRLNTRKVKIFYEHLF